jgi:hypothetical protein
MNAVRHVSDGDVARRPARKEGLKEAPAYLPMQPAHAIHSAATADGQISHDERLRRVVRVLPTERKQILGRYAEPLLGVTSKILLDEGWIETIETGCHRSVGGEEIAGSRNGQRDLKGLGGRSPA